MRLYSSFQPEVLSTKNIAGYCVHLQSKGFRFVIEVRITI